MLNLKKGLALVLAAATAFTFAPVANLGNAVQAEAATDSNQTERRNATNVANANDVEMTKGKQTAYYYQYKQANLGTTYYVSSSNPRSVIIERATDNNNESITASTATFDGSVDTGDASQLVVADGKAFIVEAVGVGSSVITVKTSKGASTEINHFTIKVNEKSDTPNFSLAVHGTRAVNAIPSVSTTSANEVTVFSTNEQQTATIIDKLSVSKSDLGHSFTIASASVPSVSADYVTAQLQTSEPDKGQVYLRFLKVGTATVNLSLQDTTENNKGVNITLTFNIKKADSTLKVDNSEITDNTNTTAQGLKTITLTEANSTADLGATLADARSNEALSYFIYKVDKDGLPDSTTLKTGATKLIKAGTLSATDAEYAQSGDLTIANGKVSATANALNNVEQYYAIAVANRASTSANKVGWIRVVSIRNTKLFTNVALNVDGKDYKAAAKYNADGSTADGSANAALEMSMQDFTSADFTATGNGTALAASEITSSDPSTVAVDGTKLVAKKVGTSIITFTKKSDTTHYGNASISLTVTVSNRYVKNEITADDITLSKAKLTAQINAKSNPVTTYHYAVGNGTADKWTDQSDSHITVSATGLVTFNGNGFGTTQIRITGDPTTNAAAPKAKVINVTYSSITEPDLKVTTKSLKLDAGETGSIVATGTALTYTSSDEDVATVDANGTVTAVAEGTAVITVKSAGSATVSPDSDIVIVTVKGSAQKPAKVTGLKVSNKKGAYVSVKWTSQGKNINYRVYKKVGNGKWVGKNVAGSKTTLSVKKGAKVQVKVKSYVKDSNGKTTWGPAATKAKTFKTDKK
jgi:hypothetical protein